MCVCVKTYGRIKIKKILVSSQFVSSRNIFLTIDFFIRQEIYFRSLFISLAFCPTGSSGTIGNDINMWRTCIKRKCSLYFTPFNLTLIGQLVINELLPYIMTLRLSKVNVTTITHVGLVTIGAECISLILIMHSMIMMNRKCVRVS